MAIVGNVFGLSDVYAKQVQNTINNNLNNWPEISSYGYFIGGEGYPPPPIDAFSVITRLEFSNDTVVELLTSTGNFNRSRVVSCHTPLFGYYSGGTEPGATPTFSCSIERLDYSTDVVTDTGKGYNEGTLRSAMSQNKSFSFNAGGQNDPSTVIDTVYKFEFSNETVSSPGNNLPAGIGYMAGTQSDDTGYYAGGTSNDSAGASQSDSSDDILKLDFSTETLSDYGTNLPAASAHRSVVESPERGKGYLVGGAYDRYTTPSDGLTFASLDRLDFADGTVTSLGNTLENCNSQSCVSSNDKGYLLAGRITSQVTQEGHIFMLDFDTETMFGSGTGVPNDYIINEYAGPGTPIGTPEAKNYLGDGTVSSGKMKKNISYGDKGYTIGGAGPNSTSNIHRIDMTNETWRARVGLTGYAMSDSTANLAASTCEYGYIIGGSGGTDSFLSKITRLEYHTEVSSYTPTSIVNNGHHRGSQFHSNQYGYYTGGRMRGANATTNVSTTHRIEFSTEIRTLVDEVPYNSTANGDNGFSLFAASYNGNYGFIHGPSDENKYKKLDYGTETWSDSPQGTDIGRLARKTISPSHVYFFGGPTLGTNIKKFDLVNETTTSVWNASYPYDGSIGCGVFDKHYGYLTGGFRAVYAYQSQTNKFDFAAETITSSTSLPESKYLINSAINSN